MLGVIVRCNLCTKELPTKRIETPFGSSEVVEVGKTKVWGTKKLFRHLCKECALTIDNELLRFKLNLLESTK